MIETEITVVVPVLDESERVERLCRHLGSLPCPAIVVDGGSTDGTYAALGASAPPNMDVRRTSPGRARQMNFGASLANAEALLFLHADTHLPPDAMGQAASALSRGRGGWGRFDVAFDPDSASMRTVAWFMNRRSALTGICTGDQAMFVTTGLFRAVGGFPEIPLMEDIALSRRLKRSGWPARIRVPVTTSSRRWHRNGVLRTVAAMWWLRALYWTGASPAALAKRYTHVR